MYSANQCICIVKATEKMKPTENCQSCKQKFNKKSYASTRIVDGSVIIKCSVCGHLNCIREDAKCGWPFVIKGPLDNGSECKNIPEYVLPYRSFSGVKFICICSTHFHNERHPFPVFPMRSTKTKERMHKKNTGQASFLCNFISDFGF